MDFTDFFPFKNRKTVQTFSICGSKLQKCFRYFCTKFSIIARSVKLSFDGTINPYKDHSGQVVMDDGQVVMDDALTEILIPVSKDVLRSFCSVPILSNGLYRFFFHSKIEKPSKHFLFV